MNPESLTLPSKLGWGLEEYYRFWLALNDPPFWFRETWMALAAATAESPLLTIFSSSPILSDRNVTFELVDWTNLFAVSREVHN